MPNWFLDKFWLCAAVVAGVVGLIVWGVALAPPDRLKQCCAWEDYNTTCTETGIGFSHRDGSTSTVFVDVPCVKKRCYMYVVNWRGDNGHYANHSCPATW